MRKKPISFSTLNKYFRDAVLQRDGNTCQICGHSDKPENLEAHHIIHKGQCRLLRFDINNGVGVHAKDCHKYADTENGKEEIKFKIGYERWTHIKKTQQILFKDYLTKVGITSKEFREIELQTLKKQIK